MKKLILTLFVSMLMQSAFTMEMTPGQQLLEAIEEGNFPLIKKLVLAGADVNCHDAYGFTPLMRAAEFQRENVCAFLLKHGAHINEVGGEDGGLGTALHLSFITYNVHQVDPLTNKFLPHANPSFILFLLKNGADPFIIDFGEHTPLLRAAYDFNASGNPDYIKGMVTIINYFKGLNNQVKTMLLCLNRLRNDRSTNAACRIACNELYLHFRKLLLPYMDKPIPINNLLEMRDAHGNTAYDYVRPRLQARCNHYGPRYRFYHALEILKPESVTESKCTIL